VGIERACTLVGRVRATHYRTLTPPPRVLGPRLIPAPHPASLDDAEQARIIALLTSAEYQDLAVPQVWARELDQGRYYASQRTMYRLLTAHHMSGDRRRQATHPAKKIPELIATTPHCVWSWDITKMRGPSKGAWYHAYVVISIFSRYIVGWRVETYEDGVLAAELVEDIVTEQEIRPGYLHADRGAAMTSKPLSSLLSDLDVTKSHSRPRVSNDNPYSEAQFKTMKYVPDYPERFASVGEARAWMDRFVSSYNHEHRHSGIGYYTPASVHYDTWREVQKVRQATLDAAHDRHPERFRKPPVAAGIPERVTINDPDNQPKSIPT
jgi:putative transposase